MKTYVEILWDATFLITACLWLAGGFGTKFADALWDGITLYRLGAFWLLEMALDVLQAPEAEDRPIGLMLDGEKLANIAWQKKKGKNVEFTCPL